MQTQKENQIRKLITEIENQLQIKQLIKESYSLTSYLDFEINENNEFAYNWIHKLMDSKGNEIIDSELIDLFLANRIKGKGKISVILPKIQNSELENKLKEMNIL